MVDHNALTPEEWDMVKDFNPSRATIVAAWRDEAGAAHMEIVHAPGSAWVAPKSTPGRLARLWAKTVAKGFKDRLNG